MKKTKSDRFCRATEVRVNKNTKISLSGKTHISKHQEIFFVRQGGYIRIPRNCIAFAGWNLSESSCDH